MHGGSVFQQFVRLPHPSVVHPAGRIINFGMRNRDPEIAPKPTFLKVKNQKKAFPGADPRFLEGSGGEAPRLFNSRRSPNMVQNGPETTPKIQTLDQKLAFLNPLAACIKSVLKINNRRGSGGRRAPPRGLRGTSLAWPRII